MMSDLIFRENVLKNFENMCEDCFAYTREKKEVICRRCFIQTVKDIIKESPSEEPERKTGRWVLWNEPGCEYAKCTACGEMYDQDDLYIGGNDYPKFCPNCGAKME